MELTGFSKQVLNAWERRYRLMVPRRGTDGVRVYSDTEVYRLQLLRKCMSGGHRIGDLAPLQLGELKRVALMCDPVTEIPMDEMVSAVQSMDAGFIEARLSVHFATLGPVRFAELIVVPLMAQVGSLWQQGQVSIAAEHCVTAIIRTLLGQGLRFSETSGSSAIAVFTTPEGEQHELGALTAAILAQSCGVRALYMGAQLPIASLAQTSQTLGASVVGLSSSTLPKKDLTRHVKDVISALPPDVEVWLGGHAFSDLKGHLPGRASYFEDIPDYLAAIHRHNTRMARR